MEASSSALIEGRRSVVTDGTGQYKIENLRPGPWLRLRFPASTPSTGFLTAGHDRQGSSFPDRRSAGLARRECILTVNGSPCKGLSLMNNDEPEGADYAAAAATAADLSAAPEELARQRTRREESETIAR